jgi:hypothetical protein
MVGSHRTSATVPCAPKAAGPSSIRHPLSSLILAFSPRTRLRHHNVTTVSYNRHFKLLPSADAKFGT